MQKWFQVNLSSNSLQKDNGRKDVIVRFQSHGFSSKKFTSVEPVFQQKPEQKFPPWLTLRFQEPIIK
jgi:hypothetical protein